jgi:hypothetical protein
MWSLIQYRPELELAGGVEGAADVPTAASS